MFGQLQLGGNPQFSSLPPPVSMSVGSLADHIFDAEDLPDSDIGQEIREWFSKGDITVLLGAATGERPVLRKDPNGRKYLEFTGTKRMTLAGTINLPAGDCGIVMVVSRDSLWGATSQQALLMTFNGPRHYYRESTQVRLNDGSIKGGHGGELNSLALDILTLNDRSGINLIQNGVTLQNAASLSGGDITGFYLGRRDNNTIGYVGKIYYIELFESQFPGGVIGAQANDKRIRDIITWNKKTPKIVWQGNSLIEGYKQTTKAARPVEQGYSQASKPMNDFVVRGYAGATTDVLGVGTMYDQWVYPHFADLDEVGHPNGTGLGQWLVIWELSNTMFGQGKSDTDTYADLIAYTGQMKTAFPDLKIAVVTCIPRKDASMDPKRLSINAMVKGGGTLATGRTYVFERNEDSIDVIIDPCLITEIFTEEGCADNTTYYDADKIHLKNAGAAQIGIAFADFINYVYDL